MSRIQIISRHIGFLERELQVFWGFSLLCWNFIQQKGIPVKCVCILMEYCTWKRRDSQWLPTVPVPPSSSNSAPFRSEQLKWSRTSWSVYSMASIIKPGWFSYVLRLCDEVPICRPLSMLYIWCCFVPIFWCISIWFKPLHNTIQDDGRKILTIFKLREFHTTSCRIFQMEYNSTNWNEMNRMTIPCFEYRFEGTFPMQLILQV